MNKKTALKWVSRISVLRVVCTLWLMLCVLGCITFMAGGCETDVGGCSGHSQPSEAEINAMRPIASFVFYGFPASLVAIFLLGKINDYLIRKHRISKREFNSVRNKFFDGISEAKKQ